MGRSTYTKHEPKNGSTAHPVGLIGNNIISSLKGDAKVTSLYSHMPK